MRERDYEPQVLPQRERNSHQGPNVNSKSLPRLSQLSLFPKHFNSLKALYCSNLAGNKYISHFVKFPYISTESIELPDLLRLESTSQNSICIPGIPWPVGSLKTVTYYPVGSSQTPQTHTPTHTHTHTHTKTMLMCYSGLLREASLRNTYMHILIRFWRPL